MKRELAGICRTCILNLGMNNPSWDIKVTESQPINDYKEFTVTTDLSRREGEFEPYQLSALIGLAAGLGLNFSIAFNCKEQALEFYLN